MYTIKYATVGCLPESMYNGYDTMEEAIESAVHLYDLTEEQEEELHEHGSTCVHCVTYVYVYPTQVYDLDYLLRE